MTRQSSRAARGLVSIQSRLNQITDESSSTGQKLTEWYREHNIAIYDQEGQIRSLYDILGDVSKIWGTLDKNQQLYYLNTQAGANQTQNLAAALNNYNHVQEATETALNSSGSAIRQNGVYMDSLEARTKSVKAEFEDFANKTINNGLLKALLGLAKNGLEIVNTKFGRFITVATLATGALAGLFTLIKFFNIASLLASPLGLAAAAIGVLVSAMVALSGETEKTRLTLKDFNDEIENDTKQLTQNRERLEEINKIPWNEKTDAIKRENAELETQNAKLEKNIALKTKEFAAGLRSGGGANVYVQTGIAEYSVRTSEQKDWSDTDWFNPIEIVDTAFGKVFGTNKYEENHYYSSLDAAIEAYKTLDNVVGDIEINKYAAEQIMSTSEALKLFTDAMNDTNKAYDVFSGYQLGSVIISENEEQINNLTKSLWLMREVGIELTDEEQEFLNLASIYGVKVDGVSDSIMFNTSVTDELSGQIKELNGAIVDNNGVISINIDKLFSEENQANHTKEELADLAAKVILLNNTQMTSQQKVLSLLRIAQAAGMAGDALTLFNEAAKGDTRAGQALIAKYGSIDSAWNSLTATNVGEVANTPALTGSGGGGGSSGSGGSSSSSSANNAIQKQLDAIGDKIDQINEKYDIQIKALESANDELKRQLELEQKLADLEEARSKRVLVYKDGRFQYANDIDAIANAQNALNAYNRELELQTAKDAIEAARKAELAPWEAQKEKLEKQKRGYASGTLSAAGGLSLVGERGAELRVLNKGDGIIPANMTKNLMQWGKFSPKQLNTGNTVFNISGLSLPNVRNAEDFIAGLKNLAMQRAYKRA